MAGPVLVFGVEGAAAAALRDEEAPVIIVAQTEGACLRLLYEERPQLVAMDISGGQEAGVQLCRLIRQICDVPILCLVPARSEALVACLEAGADDCVVKPVGGPELKARVQALLRRAGDNGPSSGRLVSAGDITIDFDAHLVSKRGILVALSPREFKLLAALAERRNRLVPHEELLSRVWGGEFINDTHYLRLYIGYLRQKLEDDPRNPRYILTEWGVGYRLCADGAASSGDGETPHQLAAGFGVRQPTLGVTAAG